MIRKDYIYIDTEGNYRLLDPAMLYYFSKLSNKNVLHLLWLIGEGLEG